MFFDLVSEEACVFGGSPVCEFSGGGFCFGQLALIFVLSGPFLHRFYSVPILHLPWKIFGNWKSSSGLFLSWEVWFCALFLLFWCLVLALFVSPCFIISALAAGLALVILALVVASCF